MQNNPVKKKDVGSIVCGVLLLIIGGVFYYDTTTMLDSDSYVFPRAIIFLMVIIAVIKLVQDLLVPVIVKRDVLDKNSIRSVLMLLVLGVSIAIINIVGFFIAILIAFFALMYLSMYEKWTSKRITFYPIFALLSVASIYLLFTYAFGIQFPEGALL